MRTFAPKYRAEYNKIKDMTKHLPEAYQLKERIYWVQTGRDYVADQRDTHKKTKEDKLAKANERKQREVEKKRLAQLVKQTGRELARDARIRPVGPARCCGVCNAAEVLWSSNKATFLPWCSPTCRSRQPDVEAKRLATCMEKYGDITSARNSDVKQRKNETCLARYGAITPLHDPTISENIRVHMLENYGSERAGSSPIIQAKVKSTLADKYGVSNFGEIQKVAAIAERAQKTRIDRWWPNRMENISNQITPEYEVGDYTHRTEPMPYKCVDCSTGFLSMLMDGSTPRCLTCYPLFGGRSRKEKQITEHLVSNHIKFVENTRKIIAPRELDVFIPDKSVAIEFNGLFWHSVHNYTKIDARYHLNKTLACEAAGVQLLHVFEDEWDNKSDIVKSVINAKLGIFEVRVYARKCQVVQLTATECNQFLAANHIQGADSSSVRLGLMYDNKLTAVMTFGKSRFNKNYEYEMYRFCTKLNTQIVGGAAKLLSHFSTEYKPTSIISYADRRYSTGGLYNALGFTLLHSSKPAYQYVKSTKGDGGNYTRRFNRTQFQKHKLSKMLAVFNPNLTEAVNMHNNGYHKIYDCGTHVFVKTFAIP
jgi:DNA-directed RNA polymerase subunit RPC12/RpoP